MSSEAVEYVRGISVVKVFQQTIFSFKRFYDSIIAYRDLVPKYTLGWQKPMSLYTVAINSFAFLLVPVVILLIGNKSENIAPIITDMFLYVLITPVIATNVMKVMYLQQDMFLADQAISRVENLTSSEPLPIAENPEKIESIPDTIFSLVLVRPATSLEKNPFFFSSIGSLLNQLDHFRSNLRKPAWKHPFPAW